MRFDEEYNEDVELGPCPVCKLTDEGHRIIMRKWGGKFKQWDVYRPILYTSRLLNQAVVECQNCNFTILLGNPDEAEVADVWNELSKSVMGEK